MREIKFRGRRVDNGEWVCGYYLKSASTFIAVDDGLVDGHFDLYQVDPATVGQYTGLKDEKKCDLFKGDICKDCEGELFIVSFSDGAFKANYLEGDKWDYLIDAINQCEVIGNIWDNPELLGGETNDGE